MFSSANSGNGISLPQLLPCFNLTNSLVGFNDDEALLHCHHDLLSHCLLESPANKSTSIGPENCRSSGDHSRPLHTHKRRQSQKKDRHSKIFTAQGPRDRRVRLSMDIARKFFDLQDLLGFDKASKTLDWLLTKSKTAIKELIQMKRIDDQTTKRLCSSECENLDSKGSTASKRKRMRNPVKHKEAKAPKMAAFGTLSKELRAKARARARERTKEKNFLRKLSEGKKLTDLIPSIPNQPRPWSQIGYCKTSDSNCHSASSLVNINTGINGLFCYGPQTGGEVDAEEIFKESVMIKRKLKPSSLFAFQPNRIISTESGSNFSQWFPNATENWDIGTITSSSLCVLTNMSPSGGKLHNELQCACNSSVLNDFNTDQSFIRSFSSSSPLYSPPYQREAL